MGRPAPEDQRAFLMLAYFGADDPKDWFISRAYRDMSRTLHGLSRAKNPERLREGAKTCVRKQLVLLQQEVPPCNVRADSFDEWHRSACKALIDYFHTANETNVGNAFTCYYGQAQKWINMAIKYCWFFKRDSGLMEWYPVAHVPWTNTF
jgi:hypothetical protein